MKRAFLVGLLLLAAGSAAQAQMSPAQMKWGPAPPGLPPGAKVAVLAGDPGKEGLFTIRIRFPAGYRVPPHHHPADEHVTVIQGSFALGHGDTFDASKLQAMVPGGYAVAKAGMNHYVRSRSGGIVQITSLGPFKITYANPKDDPRAK